MYSLHGSSASVSSGGGTGPSSTTLPTRKKKQRYSSRSNSLSSRSVVTVKRPDSRSSSSTGVRNSLVPMRSQSPTDTTLIALRVSRDMMSQDAKRRKSVAVDSTGPPGSEGLDTVDRWSHSTTSSKSSAKNHRKRASSGAVLPNVPPQTFTAHKKRGSIIDHSPRVSPQRPLISSRPSSRRRQSPATSPEPERRRPSRPELFGAVTALPPLHTTPALTDPNDTESPSTIQTVATPSTQSSYGQDYFGDENVSPRNKAKNKKPILVRAHTASMSLGNSSRLQSVEVTQHAVPRSSREEDEEEGTRVTPIRSKYAEIPDPQQNAQAPAAGEGNSRERRSRTGEKGERDKKAMLSKALQKANTAVLLDNAQNFEGALEAYSDACRLLQQVMDRSSAVQDKRKLDAIRVTYTNRVEELRQLEFTRPEGSNEKSLPTRPMSDDSIITSPDSIVRASINANLSDTASVQNDPSARGEIEPPKLSYPEQDRDSFFSGTMQAVEDSTRQDFNVQKPSAQPEPMMPEPITINDTRDLPEDLESSTVHEDEIAVNDKIDSQVPASNALHLDLPPPEESRYMPAPLSPRRPLTPNDQPEADQAIQPQPVVASDEQEDAPPSQEPADAPSSWLDTIDEDGSSCSSSVHSVSSQQELRRKYLRAASAGSNPDFDAAFDAAVEAAYNEGLEPDLEGKSPREPTTMKHDHSTSIAVSSSDIKDLLSPSNPYFPNRPMNLGLEDEDEERLLDDITQDYAQTFNFDLATKSALPRQSDSSGYSRSTWQSSQMSDRTTAATSLSTVAEDALPPPGSKNAFATSSSLNTIMADPSHPPPSAPPPQTSLPQPPSMSQNRMSGVRSRRLSGQNLKQLKIETSSKTEPRQRASTFHHSVSPFKEEEEHKAEALEKDFKFGAELQPTTSVQQRERTLKSPPSLDMLSVLSSDSRPVTATTVTTEQRQSFDDDPGELTSVRPTVFRKNKSSVSLKEHTLILNSPSMDVQPSYLTPLSSTFATTYAKRNNDGPLAMQRATLQPFGPAAAAAVADGMHTGGVYLFDTSLSNSQGHTSPTSPRSQSVTLEPCPQSFLLRPFWLMRSIASSITNPKGGFLTSRLFVPHEAWSTKGVKLKSVEDKIANCDLLTAALGRLAGVDTYDADAVMEELQNFEEVMERVQNALVKKLGSDVGIGGLPGMFKEAAGVASSSGGPTTVQTGDNNTISGAEKTKSKESKGYLNSWRKLRSKSSGAPISTSQTNKGFSKTAEKELPTMQSVPMTSYVPVERRGQKRDGRSVAFEGPNKEYMGSLVRLFEGVQVLDQIARQVEDPGLKGSSPTHVGLELSIRHASEFFGFYVCRFVLADVGTLLDKFVKRGTEWVLA